MIELTLSEKAAAEELADKISEFYAKQLDEYNFSKRGFNYTRCEVFGLISAIVRMTLCYNNYSIAEQHTAARLLFERLLVRYDIIRRLDDSGTRIFYAYDGRMIEVLTDHLIGQAFAVYQTNIFQEPADGATPTKEGLDGAEGAYPCEATGRPFP